MVPSSPPTFHRVVQLFASVRRSLDAVHRMAARLADASVDCRDIRDAVGGVRAAVGGQDWVLDLPLEDEHWDRVLRPALAPDDLATVESGLRALRDWLVGLSQSLQTRHAHKRPHEQADAAFRQPLSAVAKSRNAAALGFAAFSNATAIPETGPLRVIMSVADQCNYRCRTCYQSLHQDFAYYDISSSDLAEIAHWFRFATSVTVGGFGEPLLSPAAAHVLAAAKAAGAATTVVTNGSLLERLNGLPPLDRIEISLDGASKAVLETVRSGARLDTIVAGLRGLAREQRANVVFNVVVNKLNVAEITDIVALARREGLREVCLQTFDGYLPWHDDMRLTPADLQELDDQVAQARIIGSAPLSSREFGAGEFGAGEIVVRDLVARQADARATAASPAAVLRKLDRLPHPKPSLARGKRGLAGETQALMDRIAPSLPAFVAALAAARRPVTEYFTLRAKSPDLPTAVPYCMEPFSTIVVKSDGATNPCCKLDWNMGNINDRPVEEIWNGAAYRTLRASLISRRDMPATCLTCRDGNRTATLPFLIESMLAIGAPLPRALVPPDVHLVPEIAELPPIRTLLRTRRRPRTPPRLRDGADAPAGGAETGAEAALELRPGGVRLFNTADLRILGMGLGWSDPEDGHTWNDGPEAAYTIAVAAPPAALQLEISGTPFIAKSCPRQEISLFCNGRLSGTRVMTVGRDHRLAFPLQPPWWQRRGRRWIMSLVFHLPYSIRPCDRGLSEDARELGFAFRSICLREFDPALAELANSMLA